MTYRYIYKITCTAGSFKDKFYFGQHTTTNLDDGYKGSGKKINDYYKKHSKDYIKEIISYHNTDEELNQAEYDIIKPWLGNPMCLNLRDGGDMGTCSEETKQKISKSRIGKTPWNKGNHGISEETRIKLSESHKGIKYSGRKSFSPTEETRKIKSELMKGNNYGFKKGNIPWNKGKKNCYSEESIKRMTEAQHNRFKKEAN